MKRKGTYKPTIEDAIEISGIEILHPGGHLLTQRTAELGELKKDLSVLDVSCGRGKLAIYYAEKYGVNVTGIDISKEMINTAEKNTENAGLSDKVKFIVGDSQILPFADNTFDVVINECAVGIPDDSQKVLDEMTRVTKPGGKIIIHESTWLKKIPFKERDEFSERYGTTPMELPEWIQMLEKAGVKNIYHEYEKWSKPEMFWKIREDRDVKHWLFTMSISEKLITFIRICKKYGCKGISTMLKNENVFYKTLFQGKIGYTLFKGEK